MTLNGAKELLNPVGSHCPTVPRTWKPLFDSNKARALFKPDVAVSPSFMGHSNYMI
jgi:hypothetical protein